jgi:hypothetical protein
MFFYPVKHQFWLKKLVLSLLELQPAVGYELPKQRGMLAIP